MSFFGEIKEPVKKKRNSNTVISKEFLSYYNNRYKELFGIPPNINWGKDIKLINIILKTYEDVDAFNCDSKLDFLTKACEKYFLSKDVLALKSGWNIGVFYNNFSKIALLLKHVEDSSIFPIQEGYKLAYLNYVGHRFENTLQSYDEGFSQIFLYLNPLWKEYGQKLSLKRFSELYFLILFEYKNKICDVNFFITKTAMEYFIRWLKEESKDYMLFLSKDIVEIDKNKLEEEMELQKTEDFLLLHLRDKKEIVCSVKNRKAHYEELFKKCNINMDLWK